MIAYLLGVVTTLAVLTLLIYWPELRAAWQRAGAVVLLERADAQLEASQAEAKAQMRAAVGQTWRDRFEP